MDILVLTISKRFCFLEEVKRLKTETPSTSQDQNEATHKELREATPQVPFEDAPEDPPKSSIQDLSEADTQYNNYLVRPG